MSTIFLDKDGIDTIVPANLSTNSIEAKWWNTIPCLKYVSKLKSVANKAGKVFVCLTTDKQKLIREEYEMKLNNKGFSLLEVLVSIVIMAIIMEAMLILMASAGRSNANLNKTIAKAQSTIIATAPKFVIVKIPLDKTCLLIENNLFVLRTGNQSVTVYTDASCGNQFKDFNTGTNSVYFNEASPSIWTLGGDSDTLKIVIMKGTF